MLKCFCYLVTMTFFCSNAKAALSKNTLETPGPIYHNTSEEQKRAQAYIIAGYVPFGHHFEKAKENNFKSDKSQNVCDLTKLQDLYLNQPDRDYSLELEEEFPYDFDEQDPYNFDTEPALPDLITDLTAIKREQRDYPGRTERIIRLNKKEKVHTEGRILSETSRTIAALNSENSESYQNIPSNFALKRDPKAAIGKMASSVHVGVVGANERNAGDGSHQGSISSMAQSQGGGSAILHSPFKISDLIHPSLNDPLKHQQQVTFRLVKTGRVKWYLKDHCN